MVSRNLDEQMRLSLRGILAKQMASGRDTEIWAAFLSDESGFPLTGLKRSPEGSIADMTNEDFEQMSALLPQIWEHARPLIQGLDSLPDESPDISNLDVNHIIVGFKRKNETRSNLELMITRLDELFLSSLYSPKK